MAQQRTIAALRILHNEDRQRQAGMGHGSQAGPQERGLCAQPQEWAQVEEPG